MYDLMASLAVVILAITVFVWIVIMLSWAEPTNSEKYRKLMADMYVVGMIRQLAQKDNINLIAEMKDFSKMVKKTKLDTKYLDRAVEEELKEDIAERFEAKRDELKNAKEI